nr:MAG TPA: hypothetical protein [Caudoviricetes sp.]
MTTEDKKAIIKFIKFRYINYISNRQIDGLIDLSDEMSIKHPHYETLVGFIEWICKQTNSDRRVISELENASSIDVMCDIIKCEYSVYLNSSYLEGVETLLDWLSFKHPHYDALEACIKFACERSQLFSECIDYLGGLKCEG